MKSEDIRDFISFQIHRQIVSLYKKYIVITEDLRQEHLDFVAKVEDETSSEFAKSIDYFNSKKYNYIRKKILDAGNETIRDLEKILSIMNISLDEDEIKKLKLIDLIKEGKKVAEK